MNSLVLVYKVFHLAHNASLEYNCHGLQGANNQFPLYTIHIYITVTGAKTVLLNPIKAATLDSDPS